eukprot:10262957-Ditylum_brightwellii.AAC.1
MSGQFASPHVRDYCPPFILEDTPVQVCTDLVVAFGVLGAMEHVASAGNVGNCLIVLAAKPVQGVHGLDLPVSTTGGIVQYLPVGCLFVGQRTYYAWALQGGNYNECCLPWWGASVLSMTYLAKAKHLQSWVISMLSRP